MRFFFNKKHANGNGSVATVDDSTAVADESIAAVDEAIEIENEIAGVIALTLHKYIAEVREYENTVITIQQVIKPYSPWSSKIYGLRQQPMHIPGLRTRTK